MATEMFCQKKHRKAVRYAEALGLTRYVPVKSLKVAGRNKLLSQIELTGQFCLQRLMPPLLYTPILAETEN